MWQPIETAPNNVFDVIAKYWDAEMDRFLIRRVCDCVLVNNEVCVDGKRLTQLGFRATHWMDIPTPPETTSPPLPAA